MPAGSRAVQGRGRAKDTVMAGKQPAPLPPPASQSIQATRPCWRVPCHRRWGSGRLQKLSAAPLMPCPVLPHLSALRCAWRPSLTSRTCGSTWWRALTPARCCLLGQRPSPRRNPARARTGEPTPPTLLLNAPCEILAAMYRGGSRFMINALLDATILPLPCYFAPVCFRTQPCPPVLLDPATHPVPCTPAPLAAASLATWATWNSLPASNHELLSRPLSPARSPLPRLLPMPLPLAAGRPCGCGPGAWARCWSPCCWAAGAAWR